MYYCITRKLSELPIKWDSRCIGEGNTFHEAFLDYIRNFTYDKISDNDWTKAKEIMENRGVSINDVVFISSNTEIKLEKSPFD